MSQVAFITGGNRGIGFETAKALGAKGIHLIIGCRDKSKGEAAVKQLEDLGIVYDHLIMGVGGGPRVLINDLKPGKDFKTASAYNLKRNTGIKNVDE